MKAIIMAVGQDNRMGQNLQKVLYPILGKTIVEYIIEAAFSAGIDDVTVVTDKNNGDITTELGKIYPQIHFAMHNNVQECVNNNDDILILHDDMPLITGEFIRNLTEFYNLSNPDTVVVESCTPSMEWINTGIYMCNGSTLKRGLKKLDDNNQREYCLTDILEILRKDGCNVQVFNSHVDTSAFTKINTQVELAEAVTHMRKRINTRHMLNDVRMIDPSTVYIDDTVKIQPGVVIYPGVILEGNCKIDTGVTIGANSHLKNAVVGAGVNIRQSVIFDAIIGANTEVGPFAYMRQNVQIGEKCRIGNFVEIKNSTVGNETKAAHHAYIGDADIGKRVNYSCGAITSNYDGKNKHRTVIGDDVFVGSNSNLIAPVTLGDEAFVAAGSTITDDLQKCSLGIARSRQVEKLNWVKTKS